MLDHMATLFLVLKIEMYESSAYKRFSWNSDFFHHAASSTLSSLKILYVIEKMVKFESLMFCPLPPPPSPPPPLLPPPSSSSVHFSPSGPSLGIVLVLPFVPIHSFFKGSWCFVFSFFFLTVLSSFYSFYSIKFRLHLILGFSPLGAILIDIHHLPIFSLDCETISRV